MAATNASGARAGVRRAAVLLSSGALVAALNFSGVGAPEPAFTSTDTADRHPSASRSISDRIDVQPGISVQESSDPFFPIATGEAIAAEEAQDYQPEDRQVCISSPLPPGVFRISSNYGMRSNPITGGHGLHAGVDLAAAFGTPIHAVADGTVTYTGPGRAGRSSELVIIEHEVDGIEFASWYVHMYPDGVFVEAGQSVRAGEIIAEVGSNGFSTGPHLHLEIHTSLAMSGGKGTSLGRIHGLAVDQLGGAGEEQPPAARTGASSESSAPAIIEEGSETGEDAGAEEEELVEQTPADGHDDVALDPPEQTPDEGPADPEQDPGAPEVTPEEVSDPDPAPAQVPAQESLEYIEIEEDDDGGKNDHTIDDVVSRTTGVFDPSSFGMLHDPLPFLRDLGYGLAPPASCIGD